MQCLSCSKNLEGCKHRKYNSEIFCMTCEVKFVEVYYNYTSVFMIPKSWKEEDYGFKWDKLYYKDKEIHLQVIEGEVDLKYPADQQEIEDVYDEEQYFDCEEPNQT